MPDQERREHVRFEVVGVAGSTLTGEPFVATDLSRSGLCIETTARPRPGAGFRGRIEAGYGGIPLDAVCCWAHLAGVERLCGGDPATIYRAGLRFRNGTINPAILANLLRSHALVVPPRPVHCILPLEGQRLEGIDGPVAGEVRRFGLGGLSIVFPPLPPLSSPLDLVVLLDGKDCHCRGQVMKQRKSGIPGGSPSTEVLLAVPQVDGETVDHIQPHVNAVLERVLGPTGGENDQYTGLAGRGGILSMLA